MSPRKWIALSASLLALLIPLASAASAQAAGPAWRFSVSPSADYFLPNTPTVTDQNAVYTIEAENVGQPTSEAEQIVIEDTLPGGLSATGAHFYASPLGFHSGTNVTLADEGYCPTLLRCEFPGPHEGSIPNGGLLVMQVRVDVPQGASEPLVDRARISGGGAPTAEASAANEASSAFPYRIESFAAKLAQSSGQPYTHAGGHPFLFSTQVDPDTATEPETGEPAYWGKVGAGPVRDPRSIASDLPPGLIANPQAYPHCALADYFANECSTSTIVGDIGYRVAAKYVGGFEQIVPLYNLQPAGAFPGELGYDVQGIPFLITAGLRSGSDYGVSAGADGLLAVGLNRVRVTLWGSPAQHSHDVLRGKTCRGRGPEGGIEFRFWDNFFVNDPDRNEAECEEEQAEPFSVLPNGGPAETAPVPFVRLPTQCSGEPLTALARSAPWGEPGVEARASAQLPRLDSCSQIAFEPTIQARPTTDLADAPSGLQFDLHVPQNCWKSEESPQFETYCQSDLREAVVKLPAGLSVNPSSANGLGGCSPGQIGLNTPVGVTPAHFTETPAQCPAASAVGTVEVNTPLLHNPLKGSVYLATPRQNPYESLLAGYIVLEGEGLIVKLPGRIEADPETGQITGRFTENPQTPFEDFHLSFFGGARGDLRTPAVCGEYETTAELTPYSHTEVTEGGETIEATPIAHKSSSFETTEGAHEGEECPVEASEAPNAPAFHAGTESPQAGQFSPFSFRLARADGSQEIGKIETTLPPGLSGKLAGIAECSEAQLAVAQSREREGGGEEEKASPSCPSSSEVGKVEVAAGAGPTPLYVTGHAYLAGPYKGAPLSLAIITPAVAGPFDLGDVLVRTALYVDPTTAQIKAVSDPIPHILQGIPLDVRSVTLKMDRPNFTLNPTDCDELGFTGSETSVLESTAPLTQRFQVGGCSVLPFSPKLAISLKGSTKRTGHPALKAVLTMKPGEANIAKAQVTLPHSEFLDQGHIGTVCTRVQFQEGSVPGERCPAGSVYGFAKAVTPLLEKPVEGPVYLRSSSHKLPDLVAALNGQISVALDGIVDTGRSGGIRNTFEVVPDAPVSKFTLQMKGGAKGLLVNSESLCGKKPHRAEADFTAQNGKVSDTEPVVRARCPKGRKGRGHR